MIIRRPLADIVEATVVWVSGAVSALAVHPPLLRQSDRQNYDRFVERLLALGAAGYKRSRDCAAFNCRGLPFGPERARPRGPGRRDSPSAGPNLTHGTIPDPSKT